MDAQTMVDQCNQIIGGNPYDITGIIRSEAQRFATHEYDDLIKKIEAFSGSQGWLCFQSGVHRVGKGDDLKALPKNLGRVLNGELAIPEDSNHTDEFGKTLSIQQSNDQWYLATIEETSTKAPQAQSVVSRTQQLCVLSRFSNNNTSKGKDASDKNDRAPTEYARYRVYFELDESGYKPFCCRFACFTQQEAH